MRFLILFIILSIGCSKEKSNDGQVIIGLNEEVQLLNPLLSGTAYARQVEELMYLPLFQFDPNDLQLKPVLAAKAPFIETLANDSIKYSFEIRREAQWSDGKSVTAEDYVFTFKQIYNPALKTHGYRAYLSFLEYIELDEINEKKFSVVTNKPYHLAETVLGNIEIFPQHIHDPNGVLDNYSIGALRNIESPDSSLIAQADAFSNYGRIGAKNIIGSGPYKLNSWIPGESVLLEKKQDYWGQKITNPPVQLQANSTLLKFNFIKDRVVAFQELKSDGIDIMNQVPLLNTIDVLNQNVIGLTGHTPEQFTHYYIALNPTNHGLENPELRKALNQSFDLESWIEKQMFGLAIPVTNPISPLKNYYDKSLPIVKYNIRDAIKVFEKHGFDQIDEAGIRYRKKGEVIDKLTFDLNYSTSNESAASLAIFFQEKAKLAGVEIIPKPLDFPSLRKAYRSGDYDLVFLASSVPPADYDPQQKWHTKSWGRGNLVRFGDSESDSIIDEICRTIHPEERAKPHPNFGQGISLSCYNSNS